MRQVGRWWWVPLVTGIIWLILAWILLSFDATTVWTVAIFTGIFLIFGGAAEFMMASVTPSWRWLHIVLGLLFIAFGTASFVWPQVTFVALAALDLVGDHDRRRVPRGRRAVEQGLRRHVVAGLVVGIAEILVGFWAISVEGGSIVLLVVWLAAIAIARGIMNIVLAFQARKLRNL